MIYHGDKRSLVTSPELWRWSSFCDYWLGETGKVKIGNRQHQVRQSFHPPFAPRTKIKGVRSAKDGAPSVFLGHRKPRGWMGHPSHSEKSPTSGKKEICVALLLVSALLVSCKSLCGDDSKLRAASPDHQLIANFYVRDCGATTSFSSIVNIQGASSKFDGDEGQILVV